MTAGLTLVSSAETEEHTRRAAAANEVNLNKFFMINFPLDLRKVINYELIQINKFSNKENLDCSKCKTANKAVKESLKQSLRMPQHPPMRDGDSASYSRNNAQRYAACD